MIKDWTEEWELLKKQIHQALHLNCRCHINKIEQSYKLDCYGEDFNFNGSICNECSDREDCFTYKYKKVI